MRRAYGGRRCEGGLPEAAAPSSLSLTAAASENVPARRLTGRRQRGLAAPKDVSSGLQAAAAVVVVVRWHLPTRPDLSVAACRLCLPPGHPAVDRRAELSECPT